MGGGWNRDCDWDYVAQREKRWVGGGDCLGLGSISHAAQIYTPKRSHIILYLRIHNIAILFYRQMTGVALGSR